MPSNHDVVPVDNGDVPPSSRRSRSDSMLSGRLDEKGRYIRSHGMNEWITSLFLIGEMAGAGIVALPNAIAETGFIPGLILCVCVAGISTITAILLGKSWRMVVERHPEYRRHCRRPYAEIGYCALGNSMRHFVAWVLNLTQFGSSTVLLLLTSKNLHDSLVTFFPSNPISYCWVIFGLVILVLPFSFLKSPENFWWAIVFGMFMTLIAVVFIIVGTFVDWSLCQPHSHPKEYHPIMVMSSVGTIMYTYGGHRIFPTIQHDMLEPHRFTRSAIVTFVVITAYYAPVAIFSYLVYGSSLGSSVINSIQTPWMQQAINLAIMAHCFVIIILVLNPFSQDIEERLNIPHAFGWKRVAVRTGVLACILLLGTTIPNFGPLMNLIGGSMFMLTGLILPVVFYLYLSAAEPRDETKSSDEGIEDIGFSAMKSVAKLHQSMSAPVVGSKSKTGTWTTRKLYTRPTLREVIQKTSRPMLILSACILTFAAILSVTTTVTAIISLSTLQLQTPCYVRPFLAPNLDESSSLATFCCGQFHNISRTLGAVCPNALKH